MRIGIGISIPWKRERFSAASFLLTRSSVPAVSIASSRVSPALRPPPGLRRWRSRRKGSGASTEVRGRGRTGRRIGCRATKAPSEGCPFTSAALPCWLFSSTAPFLVLLPSPTPAGNVSSPLFSFLCLTCDYSHCIYYMPIYPIKGRFFLLCVWRACSYFHYPSSSQSRADLLTLGLAVTNILTGLVWLSIRPKSISVVLPPFLLYNLYWLLVSVKLLPPLLYARCCVYKFFDFTSDKTWRRRMQEDTGWAPWTSSFWAIMVCAFVLLQLQGANFYSVLHDLRKCFTLSLNFFFPTKWWGDAFCPKLPVSLIFSSDIDC